MDFSTITLSDEDEAFRDELRTVLSEIVTDEVIARDKETGENFDEGVHLALGTYPIEHHAQPALRERWLPELARGRQLGAFAVTEPQAGSNPRAMGARGGARSDGSPFRRPGRPERSRRSCRPAAGRAFGSSRSLRRGGAGPDEHTLLWIGAEGGMESDLVGRAGIPFKTIPAAGVHGVGIRALPRNLGLLMRGFVAARRAVREFRPDALLFTGGFVAFPMAVALPPNSSIWSKTPDMVLCMVSIIVRMDSIIAICGGIWAINCGMILSMLPKSARRAVIFSLIWSTPSNVSNMDLIE